MPVYRGTRYALLTPPAAAAAPASTQTFAGSNAGITYGGRFSAPFSNAGITIVQRLGSYSEIRTVVTGTECRLRVFATGSTHRWTVDGGAEQTAAPSGSVNAWITLFTGLSDGPHTVVYYDGLYAGYSETFEVTGAAPAVAAQSGYTNTTYRINDASGLSEDNSSAAFSAEGYDKVRDRGSFRFKATTGTIRVWCRSNAGLSKLSLVTDGDPATNTVASTAGAWGWVSFTGLDSGAEHTYRLVVQNGTYCYAVMVPGGALNTTPLTAFPADYWWGDSITAASNITNGDCALNFPQWYGVTADRGWQILGTAGGTANVQGRAQKASPGAASPAVARLLIGWGFNDQAAGTTSIPNWESAIDEILTQVAADLSGKPVVWYGIIPVTASLTNRGSYNTSLAARVAAFADADVTYLSTDSLSTLSTSDGIHPDGTGAADLGAFFAANL